jgi:hypothetical protein
LRRAWISGAAYDETYNRSIAAVLSLYCSTCRAKKYYTTPPVPTIKQPGPEVFATLNGGNSQAGVI